MTALLILAALPIGCALVLVVAAWLTDADAAQGPPPALRPGADPGFDDGLEVDDLPLLDAAELLCVDHPDAIIWERGERR